MPTVKKDGELAEKRCIYVFGLLKKYRVQGLWYCRAKKQTFDFALNLIFVSFDDM